eukprot:2392877-Rhodomonas_salina.1
MSGTDRAYSATSLAVRGVRALSTPEDYLEEEGGRERGRERKGRGTCPDSCVLYQLSLEVAAPLQEKFGTETDSAATECADRVLLGEEHTIRCAMAGAD